MVKQRLWQSGKSKDCLIIELYEPEFNADYLWQDRYRSTKEVIKQYEELGWKKVDYLVSVNRVVVLLQKEVSNG
ncbi:MAG: hypothetical protein J6S67_19220 [Methanobrevibacter sp.]|nr:hypothetical protein [Methanobrevibacter sp.]